MSISNNKDNNNIEPEVVGVGVGVDGRVGDGGEDGEEKKRHVVGISDGNGDGDGDGRAWPAASSEPRRKTIGLTPDAIMEVSRLRVASLLRRLGRASRGAEIAATRSLVSLSGDFFIRDDD